tara:strand:- start:183 stop:539 length:357 start_codon:yes stop_codon:yes gene_type:complete
MTFIWNYIDREKFIYKYRFLILISPFILSYLLYNRKLYYKKNKYIFILLILITGFYTSIILYTILLAFLWIFLEMKASLKNINNIKPPNLNNKKPYPKKHTKDLNYIPPSKLIKIKHY